MFLRRSPFFQALDSETFARCFGGMAKRLQRLSRRRGQRLGAGPRWFSLENGWFCMVLPWKNGKRMGFYWFLLLLVLFLLLVLSLFIYYYLYVIIYILLFIYYCLYIFYLYIIIYISLFMYISYMCYSFIFTCIWLFVYNYLHIGMIVIMSIDIYYYYYFCCYIYYFYYHYYYCCCYCYYYCFLLLFVFVIVIILENTIVEIIFMGRTMVITTINLDVVPGHLWRERSDLATSQMAKG